MASAGAGAGGGSGGSDIRMRILKELDTNGSIEDSGVFARKLGLEPDVVVGAIKSLENKDMVTATLGSRILKGLSEEALDAVKNGSPEARLFAAVPAGKTVPRAEVEAALGPSVVANGHRALMKVKAIAFDKAAKAYTRPDGATFEDEFVATLKRYQAGEEMTAAEKKTLKARRSIVEKKETFYSVTKGPNFSLTIEEEAAALTAEMLADGSWKTQKFKPLNLHSLGTPAGGGHYHLLLKVRAEFRSILLEMGFDEMPTNRWVESSFWNFDALFQPQSHPARDAHDTFFISEPAAALSVPEDYLKRVKEVHEVGGYGSIGYQMDWKRSEAMKNILRTHTTAVSARMLYQVANQPGGFKPCKFFSIDRVFRNEALDATHLAEFHQIEGVVADYNLGLGDLIGVITEFFSRIGITNIRLKCAYNPYTEPSMEIFGVHPTHGLQEIGNSGIFRPEMLAPMGLPKDVRVIAWGLSLERPTMIRYGIDNIRRLFGHKVKLSATKHAPVVRLVRPTEAGAAASE